MSIACTPLIGSRALHYPNFIPRAQCGNGLMIISSLDPTTIFFQDLIS